MVTRAKILVSPCDVHCIVTGDGHAWHPLCFSRYPLLFCVSRVIITKWTSPVSLWAMHWEPKDMLPSFGVTFVVAVVHNSRQCASVSRVVVFYRAFAVVLASILNSKPFATSRLPFHSAKPASAATETLHITSKSSQVFIERFSKLGQSWWVMIDIMIDQSSDSGGTAQVIDHTLPSK